MEQPGSGELSFSFLGKLASDPHGFANPTVSIRQLPSQQGDCLLLLKPQSVSVNQSLLDQTSMASLGSGSNTHRRLPSYPMGASQKRGDQGGTNHYESDSEGLE